MIKRIKARVKQKINTANNCTLCTRCQASFDIDTSFDRKVGDYYLYKCPNCGMSIELSKRVPTLNFKGAIFIKSKIG